MSGRISVGCKSPLTGGIKESNAGGKASQMLGRLGIAAIVLEGKPKDDTLYKLSISKDKVDIKPDNSLKMLGNYAVAEKMKAAHGDKVSCISIGPAGEMKLPAPPSPSPTWSSVPPGTRAAAGSAPSWAPRGSR